MKLAVIVFDALVIVYMCWAMRMYARSGRWRFKGFSVYRDKTPRLFRTIFFVACGLTAGFAVFVLMMTNLYLSCRGIGSPGDCTTQSVRALMEWARHV